MNVISGKCLCEKFRYKITLPPMSQGICYCYQCQRVGGGFGTPLIVLDKNAFKYSYKGLSFFKTQLNDGSIVTRNFCVECGSHIFAQISNFPAIVTIKAATLENFNGFIPEYLVWTSEAGISCVFPPGVPSFLEDAPLSLVLGVK